MRENPGLRRDHEIDYEGLVLTKRPYATLKFFTMAMLQYFQQTMLYLVSHKLLLLFTSLVFFGWSSLCIVKGPHEQFMKEASAYLQYGFWWVGLGIASSIGLGSGLHTFVLYLGPHIAMFTMKATLCGRVDLKSAYYDTALFGTEPTWALKNCSSYGQPLYPKAAGSERFRVPLWAILHEVHWEAILWGVGTALGELPPYFVSRAAKRSEKRLQEFEDLKLRDSIDDPNGTISSFLHKIKSYVINWLQKLASQKFKFWTILLFASVPNPLFDLAGMMCGQLLVPFWSFFIPTLIGKALVKTHLQTIFVILLCNNQLVEQLESSFRQAFQHMPAVSHVLNHILDQLKKSRANYHNGPAVTYKVTPWKLSFSFIWNTIVWIMLIGFLSSIINATAQSFLLKKQNAAKKQQGND